jgi:hypothetical protein
MRKEESEALMNAVLRRRLDMATRVRDFLRAHQTDVVGEAGGAGGAAGVGLAKLEELLQRSDALVSRQRSGMAAARSATMQRQGIRDTLQTALLRYLKAVSQAAAKENPDLLAQFQMPHLKVNHRVFVAAVRGLMEKASEQKDLLVSHGMQPSLLDDLGAALAEFEKTLEASRAGRREHVGASADLEVVAAEILEQVRVLDGLMRYRFRTNADLMGEWASARNVVGPLRSQSQPAAEGPDVVKPAA